MEKFGDKLNFLYSAFSSHGLTSGLCSLCYSPAEIDLANSVPVRELPIELAGKLLDEVDEHFGSSDSFRYFLPRLLEVLAPPISSRPESPTRIFDNMEYWGFDQWPENEKKAVSEYLWVIAPHVDFEDKCDKREWLVCLNRPRYTPEAIGVGEFFFIGPRRDGELDISGTGLTALDLTDCEIALLSKFVEDLLNPSGELDLRATDPAVRHTLWALQRVLDQKMHGQCVGEWPETLAAANKELGERYGW